MVKAIHIEIDALFFLLLMVIVYQSLRNVSQQMGRVLFRYTVDGIMILLGLDILWMLVEGTQFPGARVLNLLTNAVFLSGGVVVGCIWYLYVLETLGYNITPGLVGLVMSPGLLFTVLNFLSIWTRWIFYINADNLYMRGPLFWAQSAGALCILFVSLVHILVRLLNGDTRVPRIQVVKLLRFYIVPVIGTVAAMPFSGMPGTWTCAAASVVLMYMDDQDNEILRDSLTGLNNRKPLDGVFADYTRRADAENGLYLFMIDLNSFKAINDTFGHPTGDAALVAAAKLLVSTLSDLRSIAARIGGDEFLIMAFLPDDAAAEAFKQKIRSRFAQYNAEAKLPYLLSASIGYSRYVPGQTLDELSEIADQALYRDKRENNVPLR